MAYFPTVTVQDENGQVVNPATEELLRALLMRIPPGLHVNSVSELRVQTDTNSTVCSFPWFNNNAAHLTLAVEGQHFSNQRWQQQRGLLQFS